MRHPPTSGTEFSLDLKHFLGSGVTEALRRRVLLAKAREGDDTQADSILLTAQL